MKNNGRYLTNLALQCSILYYQQTVSALLTALSRQMAHAFVFVAQRRVFIFAASAILYAVAGLVFRYAFA